MPSLRLNRPLSLLSRTSQALTRHGRVVQSISSRNCSCTVPTLQQSVASPQISRLDASRDPPLRPKADHRELAVAQKLFTTSPYSSGSPLFLPHGASIFNKLCSFLRAQYDQFGFQEVVTPTIYKKSLWEKSGHWENYAEDMFEVRGRGATGQKANVEIGEDEEFGLKPMNCPGHCLLFGSQKRSYRDLPIRYADFSALHRNEVSGALSGLTRVRRFHQDDGHIFCRPSQIQQEIKRTLDFVRMVYTTFGMGPYRLVLSTRPEDHFIGTTKEWDEAENQLKEALDHSSLEWDISEGDGAFYGPKIDIILSDSDGKEHQTATIQLDFQLPRRFELSYTTTGGSKFETPVLIHRAVLGSLERFMALLIEHYDGKYPFWLAPRPCVVLTLNDTPELVEYAKEISGILSTGLVERAGCSITDAVPQPVPLNRVSVQVDIDSTPRPLNKKIGEIYQRGYNFSITVGPKEMVKNTLMLEWRNQPKQERTMALLSEILDPNLSEMLKKGKVELDVQKVRELFVKMTQQYL